MLTGNGMGFSNVYVFPFSVAVVGASSTSSATFFCFLLTFLFEILEVLGFSGEKRTFAAFRLVRIVQKSKKKAKYAPKKGKIGGELNSDEMLELSERITPTTSIEHTCCKQINVTIFNDFLSNFLKFLEDCR